MTARKWLLVYAVLTCLSAQALAANHYVWCGGKGTGADFNNAYTDLPASLVRGDTYVVAGSTSCTYGVHHFADSGTTPITIRRASALLDAGVAGYQSSFANSQARWISNSSGGTNPYIWSLEATNYVFDGNIDSDAGEATTACGTSCGFYLGDAVSPTAQMRFIQAASNGIDMSIITLRHIEFDGTGATISATIADATQLAIFQGQGTANNWTVDHVYIHDIAGGPIVQQNSKGWTWEYVYLARTESNNLNHGEGFVCQGCTTTWSYSVFLNVHGTGVLVCLGPGNTCSMNVFGNVFWQTDAVLGQLDDGTIACIDSNHCTFNVFNNTFAGFASPSPSAVSMTGGATGSTASVYDNLWYSSQQVATSNCTGCTLNLDYNCYEATVDSTNPKETHSCTGIANLFANLTSGNFHLVSDTPINPNGLSTTALLAANSVDPDGISRGADAGTWSRGAFQFNSSRTAGPAPPTNLALVVQ